MELEEDDEQDFGSYCLVLDQGPTHYAGITACVLTGRHLMLRLDDQAEEVFGTEGSQITLDLSDLDREGWRWVHSASSWGTDWHLPSWS